MLQKLICCLLLIFSSCAEAAVLDTMPENTGFIEVQGARLFYRTYGKGAPLLMLHGGPGLSQAYLLPALSQLAENNLLIFYDQRGCGQSTGDIHVDNMTLELFMSDIEAMRQAFHADKISLFGHSWGGFLAMHYAILHPQQVDKLVLSSCMPATFDGLMEFVQSLMQRLTPFQNEMAEIHASEAYLSGDPTTVETMQRLIFGTYLYQPEKIKLLHLKVSQQANTRGAKTNDLLRTQLLFKPYDLCSALKALKLKALVIHGDTDPIPVSTAQTIHECLAHSQLVVLKNCGHFPYIEQPSEYFESIKTFLTPQ